MVTRSPKLPYYFEVQGARAPLKGSVKVSIGFRVRVLGLGFWVSVKVSVGVR